jgi:hypothetical protein
MRHTWMVLPLVLSLGAFEACSSSSSGTTGGGTGSDAGGTGSGSDGGSGNGGNTDAGSGGNPDVDGGGVVTGACSSPAGCMNGDVCCGTIPITGGTAPNCTTGTITTVCKAATGCKTNLGSTCTGVQTVRLCTTNTDCAESADNKCCTFGSDDGGTLSFCANGLIGAFGGGKCM